MGLFGGAESYVGVDIGGSSIKLVELKKDKGRPLLMTYGYAEQPSSVLKSESPEARKQVADVVTKIIQKAGVQTKKGIAALPSYAVFTSVITLPEMSKKELQNAVRWEAKKFAPMPIEEMVLDWKVLEDVNGTKEKKEMKEDKDKGVIKSKKVKNVRILITAAPKNLVNRYTEIFKLAGLELVSLETESFALERSLVGSDPSPVMVVDIGAVSTDITVVVKTAPVINRSLDLGGDTITRSIADSMNIDVDRAEQFKRDFGLRAGAEQTNRVPKRIEFMVNSIINELKYVTNLYQSQYSKQIEKIILSGGSSFLPNLVDYLSEQTKLRVYIGDPWARVAYPEDLKPILAQIGPRMGVSIGLAMREIMEKK